MIFSFSIGTEDSQSHNKEGLILYSNPAKISRLDHPLTTTDLSASKIALKST